MGIQDKVNDLKSKPKDDRVAVASGVAVTVIIILMFAWGLMFFKRVQSGSQEVQLTGGVQDQFNFTSVKQAQEKLEQTYGNGSGNTISELEELRRNAGSGSQSQQMEIQPTDNIGNQESGGFGQSEFPSDIQAQ